METAASALIVTATSDNSALVPNDFSSLTLVGAGAERTLVVTPAANQSGRTNITVTVTDEQGNMASDSFTLVVASDLGLVVDSAEDETDGDFSSGNFSLREAIARANATVGIQETITFADSVTEQIILSLGELEIADSVTIVGLGPDKTIINANETSRVLNVTGDAVDVRLEGLSLLGGKTIDENQFIDGFLETINSGGGIRFDSSGTLSLTTTLLAANSTTGDSASGGGIYTSTGNIILQNSTLQGKQRGWWWCPGWGHLFAGRQCHID